VVEFMAWDAERSVWGAGDWCASVVCARVQHDITVTAHSAWRWKLWLHSRNRNGIQGNETWTLLSTLTPKILQRVP